MLFTIFCLSVLQSVLADFRARGGRILVPDYTNGYKAARLSAEANLKKLEESTTVDPAAGKGGPLWAKRVCWYCSKTMV